MFEFSTIPEVLEELKKGKLVLVTDDKDRENEGDFICAAQFASTENVNFMAVHGRGLICMPMSEKFCERLRLPQMVNSNTDNHETAFTVSIDHISTTTGISAAERGITARKVVDPTSKPEDFRRPGHMFPLLAKKNGVLERSGHTEATVDLMKLAGLEECGLCCEIMGDDGGMLRTPQLIELAQKWDIKFTTIKALQDYRKKHDRLVECVASPELPTSFGEFRAYGYRNLLNGEHHVALVKGEIGNGKDILCRVHSECLTGDVFHSSRCDCGEQLARAMEMIEAEGRGIVLYMRQEGRGIGLVNKLRAYELQDSGLDTVDANIALGFKDDMREYYEAYQMLKKLGVRSIKIMTNNPDKIKYLNNYGLEIKDRIPIQIEASEYDSFYLKTKKDRMGHILD